MLIELVGPQSLFSYASAVHFSLLLYTLWRKRARAAVPAETRKRFVAMLRISVVFARLARRSKTGSDHPNPNSDTTDQ